MKNPKPKFEDLPLEDLHGLVRKSVALNALFAEHVKTCRQCREIHQSVLCESGYKLWFDWITFPTEYE